MLNMNSKNYMMCDFVAKEYGAIAGVLYSNIEFWIEKNRANSKHFYDGRYWTYNSIRAFSLLFPMFSEEQIKNSLKKMIDGKLILKGNFNKIQYDRTSWYTIDFNIAYELQKSYIKYTQSIMENSTMENVGIHNELCQNTSPIPYINTDINTDSVDTQNKKEVPPTPIDNSYYDITTNTYSNVEPKAKSEYEDFELLFIQAFNTLTVSVCSELFQITGFRSEDKRQRLKDIFNMRKYDYKKCINKAVSEAQKTPANKRWFHFLDFLKDYLVNGYNDIVEVSNQPSHSQSYNDYIKQQAEDKAKRELEFKQQAEELGISEAELEEQNYNEYLQSTAFLRVGKDSVETEKQVDNNNPVSKPVKRLMSNEGQAFLNEVVAEMRENIIKNKKDKNNE